jgi:hypothetical protein
MVEKLTVNSDFSCPHMSLIDIEESDETAHKGEEVINSKSLQQQGLDTELDRMSPVVTGGKGKWAIQESNL